SLFFSPLPLPPRFPLFPYTTLFRSAQAPMVLAGGGRRHGRRVSRGVRPGPDCPGFGAAAGTRRGRIARARGRFAVGEWNGARPLDRKSTRLNSSHGSISYAVFCLKK